MADGLLLSRINIDPKIMSGKPTIKGTRLTVAFILNLLAHDASFDDICREYPGLSSEDIQACLIFASKFKVH